MLPEGFYVGTKHLKVGPRSDIVVIVDNVVPDEQVGRNLRPFPQVVHESFVLRAAGGEGMSKAAFDAAQTDDYVATRSDADGRTAGILIGEGADIFVGELMAYGICHLVHKPEEQSGVPTVLCFDGCTLGTLAEGVVVVLRKAVDAIARQRAHLLGQTILAKLQHLRIRQTELSVGNAFAIAQAEIFGV